MAQRIRSDILLIIVLLIILCSHLIHAVLANTATTSVPPLYKTRAMPEWFSHQLLLLQQRLAETDTMVTERVMLEIEDLSLLTPSLLNLHPELMEIWRDKRRLMDIKTATNQPQSWNREDNIRMSVYRQIVGFNSTFASFSTKRLRDINAQLMATQQKPYIEEELALQPPSPYNYTAEQWRLLHSTVYEYSPQRWLESMLTAVLVIHIDPDSDDQLLLLLRLVKLPGARRLVMDQTVSLTPANYETVGRDLWNLDVLSNRRDFKLTGRYWYGFTGNQIRVHILDTGVNVEHEEFEGRARVHYVHRRMIEPPCSPGWDCHGHGTHVAGLVGGRLHGVAKQALILSSPVLYSRGVGEMSIIIKVLDHILSDPVEMRSVIVMSLGAPKPPGDDGTSYLVHSIIAKAAAIGVSVVVAAGNNRNDACNYLPASAPAAITVGSHSIVGRRSDFSNYGQCVDLYAPGEGIRSASIPQRNAYRVMSGTSMATPMVAGVVAMVLEQNPFITPLGIKQLLINQAKTTAVSAGADDAINQPGVLIDKRTVDQSNHYRDEQLAVTSMIVATNCIRRQNKVCLFIKGKIFKPAINNNNNNNNNNNYDGDSRNDDGKGKTFNRISNDNDNNNHTAVVNCPVIEMISLNQSTTESCQLTLIPPAALLDFYRPLLSLRFQSNQIRAWLYEDEAMSAWPARLELLITEWRPVAVLNNSNSDNSNNNNNGDNNNNNGKRTTRRSRTRNYPQHVGIPFYKGPIYSTSIQLKQRPDPQQQQQQYFIQPQSIDEIIPFNLFIELPSNCLMDHARCQRGQCDRETGICQCEPGFKGTTCSVPIQPDGRGGRKPWPLFNTTFPGWRSKVWFALTIGFPVHALIYWLSYLAARYIHRFRSRHRRNNQIIIIDDTN